MGKYPKRHSRKANTLWITRNSSSNLQALCHCGNVSQNKKSSFPFRFKAQEKRWAEVAHAMLPVPWVLPGCTAWLPNSALVLQKEAGEEFSPRLEETRPISPPLSWKGSSIRGDSKWSRTGKGTWKRLPPTPGFSIPKLALLHLPKQGSSYIRAHSPHGRLRLPYKWREVGNPAPPRAYALAATTRCLHFLQKWTQRPLLGMCLFFQALCFPSSVYYDN